MARRGKHRFHKKHFHHKRERHTLISRVFYKFRKFALRHPLVSSVGSIIVSIVLLRLSFSDTLFGNNISEFRLWFIFFAVLIGIIGLISITIWMRRNVPALFTKHDVNWKNK